eukprot:10037802-Alexandrium_andersonii.AAC.1
MGRITTRSVDLPSRASDLARIQPDEAAVPTGPLGRMALSAARNWRNSKATTLRGGGVPTFADFEPLMEPLGLFGGVAPPPS